MKLQGLTDRAPCRTVKKRLRKDLTVDEIKSILAAAKKPFHRHQDIAQQFRVTSSLVGRLVRESRRQPEKMEKRCQDEKLHEEKRTAIRDVAKSLISLNMPIYRAGQIKEAVKELTELEVDDLLVRRVMRKELKMGYRLAKQVPMQSNSERCLVLRQQYSLRMLPLLDVGRRIINVDESWLNQTRFLRRTWAPADSTCTFRSKQVAPRISLILAIDTEGRTWFALTQVNTDADVMTLFLRSLVR